VEGGALSPPQNKRRWISNINIGFWGGNESSQQTGKRRMTMNRKNKAGFTLVELMVVAIIVAILAAVAIPLMSGNTKRAIATEGQAGIGTIKTAQQVYKAEHGGYYPSSFNCATPPSDMTIKAGDFAGKYFGDSSYQVTSSSNTWSVVATVSNGSSSYIGKQVSLTDPNADFTGSLLQ
jgi:prepilin-type N-terminal cleavage/methylation domain-containing protein